MVLGQSQSSIIHVLASHKRVLDIFQQVQPGDSISFIGSAALLPSLVRGLLSFGVSHLQLVLTFTCNPGSWNWFFFCLLLQLEFSKVLDRTERTNYSLRKNPKKRFQLRVKDWMLPRTLKRQQKKKRIVTSQWFLPFPDANTSPQNMKSWLLYCLST